MKGKKKVTKPKKAKTKMHLYWNNWGFFFWNLIYLHEKYLTAIGIVVEIVVGLKFMFPWFWPKMSVFFILFFMYSCLVDLQCQYFANIKTKGKENWAIYNCFQFCKTKFDCFRCLHIQIQNVTIDHFTQT